MASLLARAMSMLSRRHSQDHSVDTKVIKHFGYADEPSPCVGDPRLCEYLDTTYAAHDTGMIYAGILWLTLVAFFGGWAGLRLCNRFCSKSSPPSGLNKLLRVAGAASRRHLLPDALRRVFGRTTRLQVLILAILAGYLCIWSFTGLTYGKWMTPIKPQPGEPQGMFDTRTTLGPWSNRVGMLAYALTPLSVLLASRESLLTLLTGVPHQHFMFMHRWVGYMIVAQSILHTVGWMIVVIGLYGPQPRRSLALIHEQYIIWGVVAIILLVFLLTLTLPFIIRRTGYEFFRKAHYVLAMVYCGACIGHWGKLQCFVTPAIILWFIDRCIRLARTFLIHRKAITGQGFFTPAQASATLFRHDATEGDVVRLDFKHPGQAWKIGQHFYLCFTDGSVWQSHPFTPFSIPMAVDGIIPHSYLFRAKAGETRKIAEVLRTKSQTQTQTQTDESLTTSVILAGPYGEAVLGSSTRPDTNILCVAGGTGITYVLAAVLASVRSDAQTTHRRVELLWFVRHASNVEWIRPELDVIGSTSDRVDVTVRIFTTRDVEISSDTNSQSSSDEMEKDDDPKGEATAGAQHRRIVSIKPASSAQTQMAVNSRRGQLEPLIEDFLERTIEGPTTVIASGPGAMMSELRHIIAAKNSASKVWKGEQRYDVSLQCDDRLEF